MNNINRTLVNSIKEGKWVAIKYSNEAEKKDTSYWINIRDVFANGRLSVQIYNHNLSDSCPNAKIYFNKIKEARLLDFTCADPALDLIFKLEKNPQDYSWLQFENFNNNILEYLEECNILDNDPHQDTYLMIDGIDYKALKKTKSFHLNEEQIDQVIKGIYRENINNYDSKYSELVMSLLSIDEGDKKYIIAYVNIAFNPKTSTLNCVGNIKLNPTFMINGKKHSISKYTELSMPELLERLNTDFVNTSSTLSENLMRGEILSTRPDITILQRDITVNLSNLFELIESKNQKGTLNIPMKAFFGDITIKDKGKKKPHIVLYDDKVNADQMLVIYSAMKNHVTYVQGPPGTGKTQTLFNVVVSSYFNNKTTLVTTMNNIPVDGILDKIRFKYKDKIDIPFPFLRLGNKEMIAKATLKIKKFAFYDYKAKIFPNKINQIKEKINEQTEPLINKITAYQQEKVEKSQLTFLKKLRDLSDRNSAKLNQTIYELENKIKDAKSITDKDLLESFSPASKDPQYLEYLYYSSISHLKNLQTDNYKELREIVLIDVEEDRVSKFNKWCLDDNNMKLLTKVFPIIFSTNISSSKLGTGEFIFDMVIMDEAGQCPIATSLIPISRADSLVLVGDVDQLKPVVLLPEETNEKLKKKFNINDNYDYCHCSIISAMQDEDKVSEEILLKHHYRCGKKIINFSNKYFYNNKLIIDDLANEGNLSFFDCHNHADTIHQNQSIEEAKGIADYIKKSHLKNVKVITPFINQAKLINYFLSKNNISDVKASTIHKVQGGEADTVIMSSAISPRTASFTMKWLDSHKEIVNVAISRAKKDFIFFGDKAAFKANLAKESIWNQLIDYSISNGKISVIPPIPNAIIDKSNGSLTEDEFFKTMSQIATVHKSMMVKRSVYLKDVFPNDPEASLSEMQFDSLILEKGIFNILKPLIAFEFNGGEHVYDCSRIECDKKKMSICKRLGLTLITIPNKYCKNYEFLIFLIKKYSKEKETLEEQLSLF